MSYHNVELIACYWTLGGMCKIGDHAAAHDESPWDFRLRAEAAGRVGYKGIGLKQADLVLTIDKYGYDGIRRILDDNGLVHLELEALLNWFSTDEDRKLSDHYRRVLFEAAERLGALHVKAAGDLAGRTWSLEHMQDEFRRLVDEARSAGTVISLEFIPRSNIPNLSAALSVMGDTAGAGAGLDLDIYHVIGAKVGYDEIARLPAAYIASVELNDAKPVPDESSTQTVRTSCGDGVFDIRGFIAAVERTGFDRPFAVEIGSAEYRNYPLEIAAQRSFETSMAQFAT